jgi:hypothetical protein
VSRVSDTSQDGKVNDGAAAHHMAITATWEEKG